MVVDAMVAGRTSDVKMREAFQVVYREDAVVREGLALRKVEVPEPGELPERLHSGVPYLPAPCQLKVCQAGKGCDVPHVLIRQLRR